MKARCVLEGAQNLWMEDDLYGTKVDSKDLYSYVEFKRKPGLRSRGVLRVYSGLDTQSEVACDTYNVEIPPVPSLPSFIAPSRESAGPRYRKISLTGRPISDEKPQSETEDDSEPFETYVDALSLSLRHEVADIAVPIPGSEMTLSVRRSYMPESWNLSGGLRPHERPDLAFGINWMTNAVSYIRMEIQDLDNPGNRTTPDSATVIDENGAAFEFAAYKGKFYPMPAGRSERHSYLNTLETETLNGVEELVFRKKYGTVLRYESVPKISLRTNTGRITPTKNFMDYHYYRLKSVEDRYGNKIMYSYKEDAKTLIPERISVDGRPDIAVHFEQNGGRITKAWDPDGNCTEYSYSEATTDPSDLYETSSENGAIEFIPDSVDLDSVSCTYLSKVSRSD